MERLVLKDGREFFGLIEATSPSAVEFMEIHRPQGKPMYLVIRPIERSAVQSIHRLPDKERELLEQRIHSFKNRARIEGRRMESVPLKQVNLDGMRFYQSEGDWLQLESTTSEELTRRITVRLEQILLAFRQVLPPRRKPEAGKTMHLKVFGTSDQYYQYLRDQKIDLRNLAYYDASRNLVVAGSDINRFADQLSAVRRQHEKLQAEQAAQTAALPEQLRELNEQLESSGVDAKERRRILTAAQQRLQKQQAELDRKIAAADRKNAALLDEIVEQMLRRLYHEAFHAYLENYVYERSRYDVPRWLNEGLAQVFESGRLEADTLRIDAPLPSVLAQLQSDLRSSRPLSVAEVLSANPTVFLVPHRSGGTASTRHYLYSWGLAYYLTFELSLLESSALEQYVTARQQPIAPVSRFEQLVNMPLSQFEPAWRKYILELQTPR